MKATHPLLRPDRAALVPYFTHLLPDGWTVFAHWKTTPVVQDWVVRHRRVVGNQHLDSMVKACERQKLAETRNGPSGWWEVRKAESVPCPVAGTRRGGMRRSA